MAVRLALVAIALCFLGCGAEPASDSGGGRGNTSGGTGGAFGGGAYPSGPYGNLTGDVIADLELFGYLRNDPTGLATSTPVGTLSFASIRDSTEKTHALIHVSGFT